MSHDGEGVSLAVLIQSDPKGFLGISTQSWGLWARDHTRIHEIRIWEVPRSKETLGKNQMEFSDEDNFAAF